MSDKEVRSCDKIINGITEIRTTTHFSTPYLKLLDARLKNMQQEITKYKLGIIK